MSKNANRLDVLVAQLAPVRDEQLLGEARSARAAGALASILETPVEARVPDRASRRRPRVLAFLAAAVAAAVLSIPAFGVGEEIVSFFAGWKDPDAPVPTASDILIASGEAGARWKLVATTSDQGLCLGLFHRVGGDRFGSAGCGYIDVRGDLPRDVRGNPASTCLGPPTASEPGGTPVPCGSLPKHWIGQVGSGDGSAVGL
jgi:hypothetical protein